MSTEQKKTDKNKTTKEDFYKLISGRGYSIDYICQKLKVEKSILEKWLKQRAPSGFYFAEGVNSHGATTYVLLPKMDKTVRVKKRGYKTILAEDQPYIAIVMPNIKAEYLNIVPIGDVYFGGSQHDENRFIEYVNWILNSPYVYCFINGGFFDRFNKADTDMMAKAVVKAEKVLSRIAHKVLWTQSGDEEIHNLSVHGYDPLKVICDKFKIPHYSEPVYADIQWNKNIFTFFAIHGKSHAWTKGGKIEAIIRASSFQEHVCFVVMGHIGDRTIASIEKLTRVLGENVLETKTQYLIICPTFSKYRGSKKALKGHPPPSRGAVSCRIFSNGKYLVSS